ncbi:hypothetical protein BJ878DRAFT_546817 [Calycina marina]|uniref:CCHC-type domain-containing protein n=1 Tax=Calycina marina TaxID=1763456 RepID=A0A9P8CAI2_9HELO|nr:hypothetical protein BJ878DRAFT_546817 [Calycina marina]
MLAKGLSTDIQKALVATPVPVSYEAYCSLLHIVSHNLESLRTKEKTEWSPRELRTRVSAKDSATMDWEPTPPQVASTKARTKAKSNEGKKFRGQCYNCQQEGHMARDCPKSSTDETPKKPKTAVTRRTKKAQAKIQETEDEESSESSSESSEDSGKEEL